jgi:hypothetical protein
VCSGSQEELEMLSVLLESEGIPSSVSACAGGEPQIVDVLLGPEGVIAPVKMPSGEPGEARLFVASEHACAAYVLVSKVFEFTD